MKVKNLSQKIKTKIFGKKNLVGEIYITFRQKYESKM